MKSKQVRLPLKSYIKPRSTAWRTTWLVMLVVIFGMVMSIVLFWRSFYLPEIKQHSYYLSNDIKLLNDFYTSGFDSKIDTINSDNNNSTSLFTQYDDLTVKDQQYQWLLSRMSFEIITNPEDYPRVSEKFIAEIFTDEFEKAISKNLNIPVTVYFKFKPTPHLWIQLPTISDSWIKQPISYYANYSPMLFLFWLLGTPLLSLFAILKLTRQINRPLERMRLAANQYLKTGHIENLATQHGPIEVRQANAAFNHLFHTLEQNEKERTVMLAGISHDLRTPLTRMRLTAEIMQDDFLKEGLVYDVEDMDAILEQFISFMQDGADEPLSMVNIDEIFKETVVQFAPLSFVCGADSIQLPQLMLRSMSIKRLIVNLVNNARKYGAEPIELNASIIDEIIPADPTDTKSLPYTQSQLIITVRDCGDGIAEKDIEKVMQPFVRGEVARTTQGSGLGLAIVNRIAKLHDGYVKIENHPKGGLQAQVIIPIKTP